MRGLACFAAWAAVIGAPLLAQAPTNRPATPLAPAPVVAAAPVPGAGGRHDLTGADVGAWLDGYLPYALRSGDVAGAVVTVVKDGQVIAAKGYGYADVATRRPVDPARTLFRPGSISKLITWTAVMQQVQAGRLDLDRDVNTYLDFRIPPRAGKPITLRQIMTHTGGFEEVDRNIIFYDPKRDVALDVYLKRWVPKRIFDAGTTPDYSNWATAVAGYIVQRVSGQPFDDYVERNIFKPLDMRTASFRVPLPPGLRPLASSGYERGSAPAKPYEFVGPAPAGSLAASGLDMAKFMIAHLENGRGILSPQIAAEMHAGPLDRINPYSLILPLNRMRLGFFETNINGHEVIGHLGDTDLFHSSLHLFLKDGVGLYASFNSAGRDKASQVIRGQLFQDFADRYFPAATPDGRVDPKTAAEHARMMVGHWEVSRRSVTNFLDILNLIGQVEVSVDGKGNLVVPSIKGPNGLPSQWVEIAPFVWRDQNGHDRLAAKVVDGKVVRWSFDLISPFMVFDRVPAWRSAGWLMPALYASLAVLLLTFLYWPAAWFVRRRYAAPLAVSGRARSVYRATRILAGLSLAVIVGWVLVFPLAFDGEVSMPLFDGLLRLLQIGGALIFVGAVGVAAWNVWLTWTDGRRWTRKLWSVLILLASLVLLFTASTYGLLAMTVNY